MTSSVSKIPKDHTSDLIVNLPYRAASGAVHLMGNFAPAERTRGDSAGREHGPGYGAGGGVLGSSQRRWGRRQTRMDFSRAAVGSSLGSGALSELV